MHSPQNNNKCNNLIEFNHPLLNPPHPQLYALSYSSPHSCPWQYRIMIPGTVLILSIACWTMISMGAECGSENGDAHFTSLSFVHEEEYDQAEEERVIHWQ